MEQHIKNIRVACIRANPEIVELKFGCLVKYNPEDLIINVHLVYWALKALRGTADKDGTSVRQFLIQDCFILGRPIRLADVLLAIGHGKGLEIDVLHGDHLFMRQGFGIEKAPTDWFGWNLRKDSLTEQSPETLEFISNLLTN